MKSFNRILVPVDFSAHSDEAVKFASDLSRRYEAPLELLHVLQTTAFPEGYELPSGNRYEALQNDLRTQLAETARAASEAGAVSVETTLTHGHAASEIVRSAKEHGCDLIVMGTRGRSGIKQLLLGSVARRVVREAACPVLTLHATEAPPSC